MLFKVSRSVLAVRNFRFCHLRGIHADTSCFAELQSEMVCTNFDIRQNSIHGIYIMSHNRCIFGVHCEKSKPSIFALLMSSPSYRSLIKTIMMITTRYGDNGQPRRIPVRYVFHEL